MSRALGRYELLRPIARGGMAEVFLARRRAAGIEKWLVVKRMRPERATDARFLELFVREARLSMSLAHQNIVPVFDFGRIDDQVFIAMERIEGKDLGSSLTRGGALLPLLAAFVAAECCQALDYAHLRRGPDGLALGIVHRDVTPRNVMLSWSGEVKLTDFGIASLAGDAAAVIGTPGYMAPEQARGEALDPRADIYAVGMVLREALTGVRPRPGNEREATLVAARAGTLVPWPESFDSPLKAIVDRATELDREARFPDARAMLEALDAYIVGERAANKSDAPTRRLAAWLTDIWKDEREETAIDEAIEGSHLVSFFDDGGFESMGTGTQNSMLATAAEEPEKKPEEPTPVVVEEKKPRRVWIVPVVLVIAGGAALAIKLAMSSPPPATVRDAAVQQDAAAIAMTPDAITVSDASEPDATVIIAPRPDAAERVRPDAASEPPADAKRAVLDANHAIIPTATTHAVKINSTPWSYFKIDDAPTEYQTLETVHLTAGAHVIHFSREHVQHDVEITVPEADTLTVTQDMTH